MMPTTNNILFLFWVYSKYDISNECKNSKNEQGRISLWVTSKKCAISISYVGNSCFIQTNSTLQPMLSEYATVLNEYWKIFYILKSFEEVLKTKCVLFATWLFKCNFWLQNIRYICNSFCFKIAMLENLIICLSKEWREGGISLQFNFMIFNNLISQPSGIDFIIWF